MSTLFQTFWSTPSGGLACHRLSSCPSSEIFQMASCPLATWLVVQLDCHCPWQPLDYSTNTISCTHLDKCQWKIFTLSLGQNNHLCKFWTTIIPLIKFLIKSSSIGEEDEALRNSATEEGRRVEAATLLLELAPSWPKQQYICFLSEYSEYI